jgi:hypothetical protein
MGKLVYFSSHFVNQSSASFWEDPLLIRCRLDIIPEPKEDSWLDWKHQGAS